MSLGKYVSMAARVLPAAVALAILPAILAGIESGCGKGVFPEVTNSGSATATATAGTGAFLYASNFNDGKIVGFKRNPATGALTSPTTTTAGSNGVMGLAITPDNGFLYAADSGSGKVYQFRIKSDGTLASIGSIAAGKMPQIIAIDNTGSWAFATNLGSGGGLNASVSMYAINASNGTLTANGSVVGFTGKPFGIAAHPSAQFVYVSDNQKGLIYSFSIGSNGKLTQVGAAQQSLGTQPGNPGLIAIVVDSTAAIYLFVPDTVNGVVSAFQIKTDGTLAFAQTWGTPSTDKPIGIVAVNNGGGTANSYVFTAEVNGNYVQSFLRSGATLTSQGALTGLNAPTGLATDPKAAFVYAGESATASVAQLNIKGACGQVLCFVTRFATESGSTSGGTQFLAITN